VSVWCTRISIDNAFGIRKAINHLVSLGRREIAFIKGPEGSGDTEERWNAVLSTCKGLGVRVDSRLTIQLERIKAGTRQTEEGRIAAETLLGRDKPFTALVAFNDISALGAMTALREAGRKVPEDVSVIGFDDIGVRKHCAPGAYDNSPAFTGNGCNCGRTPYPQAWER
jgi:LacI family transcriptional regulator